MTAAGGSTIMTGVSSDMGDLGTYNLNQGIFTTMSYNDGWQTAPHGSPPSEGYGYQSTMMALDIAVLQSKYGANTSHATGNNSYVLPGSNGTGTYYEAIWDAGGTDEITYGGSRRTYIDLICRHAGQ